MASVSLLSRKTADALSSKLHEGAAHGVSPFARRMLEKHGWTECVAGLRLREIGAPEGTMSHPMIRVGRVLRGEGRRSGDER